MKAAIHQTYDKKNVDLVLTKQDKPSIGEGDYLIKVLAAGVNPLDNMISRGDVKILAPYKLPQIAGNELVGLVTEKGADTSKFEIGDRVFARLPLDRIGAFAEYAAVDEAAIAKVPAYLTDLEAAAIPLTALTVMQALDFMRVEEGKSIFISGGTGGVGSMAIPLAKAKGLKVLTNGNGSQEKRVRDLGADVFIDYKKEDYLGKLRDVDYVLDTLGGRETEKQMSIMKRGGHLVSLKGMPNGAFAKRMQLPKWKQLLLSLAGRSMDKMANKYGVSYDFIFVESNGEQLEEVARIFSEKKIKPSIDEVYDFEDVNVALKKIASGSSRGKTMIRFGEE